MENKNKRNILNRNSVFNNINKKRNEYDLYENEFSFDDDFIINRKVNLTNNTNKQSLKNYKKSKNNSSRGDNC